MLDISLTAQSVGHDFYASQLLRGVGQMLAMMPLNQASMAAVSREEAGDAAGLYNMARNLGGSVGLALLGVYIDRRNAFHDAVIRDSVTANSLIGQDHMATTSAGFIAQAGDKAYAPCRPSDNSPERCSSKPPSSPTPRPSTCSDGLAVVLSPSHYYYGSRSPGPRPAGAAIEEASDVIQFQRLRNGALTFAQRRDRGLHSWP